MRRYRAGMDVGSTTVKLVLLDEEGNVVFGAYERHCAHTQETLAELLEQAGRELGLSVKSCDNAMQRVRRKLRKLI